MPVYDYECKSCGCIQERVFPYKDKPRTVKCTACGKRARAIISSHILRDEPTWLESACSNLLPDGNDVRPIETRSQYKKYLRDNHIAEAG